MEIISGSQSTHELSIFFEERLYSCVMGFVPYRRVSTAPLFFSESENFECTKCLNAGVYDPRLEGETLSYNGL